MSLLTYLRIGAGIAVFCASILLGSVLTLLGVRQERTRRVIAGMWAGPICRIARIRVRIVGSERLEAAGPAVVIGNQQSVLCYCIYAHLFGRVPNSGIVARLVGKWDLPLVTWLFRKTGNFMVDRENPMRSAVGLVQAREAIVERGTRVWVGPEGTRWKEPGRLGEFRPGAFRLAVETGVPLVPVVISPLKPWTDLGEPRLDPHEVEMRVLEPIPTEGLAQEDIAALRDEAQDRMQAVLTEMCGVLDKAEADSERYDTS